jgi:hypothetical protein
MPFAEAYPMANDDVEKIEAATKPGKLERVEIEIVDGGFVVSCSYRQKPSKSNQTMPMPYEGPKKKVFETVDSLKAFLDSALPSKSGNSDEDDGY